MNNRSNRDHSFDDFERSNAMKLANEISDYCSKNDWVSFWELTNHLRSRGFVVDGNLELCCPTEENVVYWSCMSLPYSQAVARLRLNEKIFLHPVPVTTYLVDGGTLSLPVATGVADGKLTTPYWLPVCLRTVPLN